MSDTHRRTIRLSTRGDAAAIAAIYAPYCESTPVSFELARTLKKAPRSIAEELISRADQVSVVPEFDPGNFEHAYA